MTTAGDDADVIAALRRATADERAWLRAALDAVRQVRGPLYEWRGGTPDASGVLHLPYPDYATEVVELVAALGTAHAVTVFDWMHWDGVGRYQDASDVQRAPLADVVRLITALVRGERFADGTIAAALDDGRLLAAAQRIADA